MAGTIRDDGPLPGVVTDSMEAQQAMRAEIQESASRCWWRPRSMRSPRVICYRPPSPPSALM